uniref:Transposase domain-containing protein n=1 Tax=Trichogramma kaykai TaxID=54128 RepID=A0ABD2XIU7_9HYME
MEGSLKRMRKHRCIKYLQKRQKSELNEQFEFSTNGFSAVINNINDNFNLHDQNNHEELNNDSGHSSDNDIYEVHQNNDELSNDDCEHINNDNNSDNDVWNNVAEHSSSANVSDDEYENQGAIENEDEYEDYGEMENQDEFDHQGEIENLAEIENQGELDEISQLKIWALQCKIPKKHLDPLLKILRSRVLPDLPKCSKTFLNTCKSLYTIEAMIGANDSPGEYTYLGIQIGLKSCVNVNMHQDKILRLDFNIDGVKMKKSSSRTLWPILCRVFYEPSPSSYKPFVVALFYGKGKPKDTNKYLDQFILELNYLLKNGLVLDSNNFKIEIRCFICDIPAKSFITHTKSHTSFNGCSKCDVVARKENCTTVYLTLGEKRTDTDFRAFTDPEHHTGVSPLISIDPEIDFINQFVIDPMHLLYLGLNSRMFEQWMNGDKVRLSASQKIKLNLLTSRIKKDIPQEFHRKMRPSEEFSDYKAVEHRFFLLYCGPFVLKNLLGDRAFNHFMLLHVACRMLSSSKAMNFATMAKSYLELYVEEAPKVYKPEFVSLNVHY